MGAPALSAPERRLLESLLARSPVPEQSRAQFERLLEYRPETRQWLSDARTADAALTLFSHSRFLTDAVIRRPFVLEWALARDRFESASTPESMREELGSLVGQPDDRLAAAQLTRYKQRQLVRIALRDLLGLADVAATTLELSHLADTLLEGALEYVHRDLERRFGRPLADSESGPLEDRFAVIALGKLGGSELNYSSDIDLLFLHTGAGRTAGPVRTTTTDFAAQLARRLTQLLSETTDEGFAYRVDLRLRPEGGAGELVSTLHGAVDYYRGRARDWELQMLIKARPVAGDRRLAERFLSLIEDRIWETSTDFSKIERLSESRDRIEERRRGRARRRTNVKLDRGGIRDVEFLVQCLQRLYGGADPFVRHGGTLVSLFRLHEKGYLSTPDYAALRSAYTLLRDVEHRLQLVDNRQTHELPAGAGQRRALERRLRAPDLEARLASSFKQTSSIYERIVGSQAPTESSPLTHDRRQRHFERTSPKLGRALKRLDVAAGARHFSDFLDHVVAEPPLADALADQPDLVSCAGDLFRLSPYLGEHLTRHPLDLLELRDVAGEAGRDDPSAEGRAKLKTLDEHPDAAPLFDPEVDYRDKSNVLRRIYRIRMFRLLADSVHQSRPVFTSLERSSNIADWVIRTAYRVAVEETSRRAVRKNPELELQVLALGRLGMREFDLGSDADLVYLLPDEAREDAAWWAAAVARMTEVISSYTREGMIFAIDSRLRPGGRDGELIQTVGGHVDYFTHHAEAWEALSYLKARPVAGDLDGARLNLKALQQLAWRRFGLSGDSASLLDGMRAKLERELGDSHPLKAGRGGYYDIDFLLLYLRLRGAVIFFDYLSTPARVEVVRASAQVTPPQAELLQSAATFYRGLDHAVRTVTGATSAQIPAGPALERNLKTLLERWGAEFASELPLVEQASVVRDEVRALYEQFFGRR